MNDAIGLAIDFAETGVDHAKYLGYDAESRVAEGSNRILQLAAIVAGIEYSNVDGTSRREIIANCEPFERLALVPEPENPYDVNAIKICRATGEQLGHVPRALAAEIAERVRIGFSYTAFFRERALRYGVEEARLIMVICEPEVTAAELAAYCRRWLRPREFAA